LAYGLTHLVDRYRDDDRPLVVIWVDLKHPYAKRRTSIRLEPGA